MSLDKFILEVLREFDVIHKKELTPKTAHIRIDMDKRKIYLKKQDEGFGKDIYFLFSCVEIYYRYYNRKPNVTKEDKLDLAKKWYSQIYQDLEMRTEE